MKPKPSTDKISSLHDARIDAALRIYGRAVPRPGLESRVAARISAEPRQLFQSAGFGSTGWVVLLRRFSAGALAAAAAVAIVVATVRHTQHISIPQAARAPMSGGVSSAGASHTPTQRVPQSATINPESLRTPPRGRASISHSQGRKAAGATMPRSPYPPEQHPSDDQQQ
jgi:hypothetical protein